MKRAWLASFVAFSAFCGGVGCGGSLVHPDTTLDRVVVYRNGVAYFERSAHVSDEQLTVRVRGSDVDDFLKSLSVVDARTRASIPVEYPSALSASSSSAVDMKIRLPGAGPHDVQLSYVVEAPAWKPTYRATLGDKGKLTLEGLAIVDNASEEDWKDIQLAVAASAALSFRFDLKTVRFMQRELFDPGPRVAPAPPPGGVPYGGETSKPKDSAAPGLEPLDTNATPAAKLAWARRLIPHIELVRDAISHMVSIARDERDVVKLLCENDKLSQVGVTLTSARDHVTTLEGAADRDDVAAATHEATVIQVLGQRADQLAAESRQCVGEEAAFVGETAVTTTIDPGLPGDDDAPVHRAPGSGGGGSTPPRDAAPPPRNTAPAPPPEQRKPAEAAAAVSTEPVGSGHFEASSTATIPSGASAMVSVFKQETAGDLVYFYDRESARGNDQYAFLALRFRNPTAEALEGGPFTVFGEGRLLGEGIADSIPGGGVAFVPYAMDRQIVVTRAEIERDEIARIVGASKGALSAEVTHVRGERLAIQNRLKEAATVYVRHTVAKGAVLGEAPKEREKLGSAELFRVEVPAGERVEVVIEEGIASAKSFDPTSREGAALVRAFLASKAADAATKQALTRLLDAASAVDDVEERIRAARAAEDAEQDRRAELGRQVATLRAGPPAGRALLSRLEKKLAETNDRLVALAVGLVALEEERLAARLARDAAFHLAAPPAAVAAVKGASAKGAAAGDRASAP
jgi:hypothetical protein